ncbi:hypothetical protein B0H16DRAFT_1747739 [Mycena metata]|uniref:MYND-type domain-containing protein n=1 Tax=Mycena metata TaxID=1033252 RepID=A0AAD7M736_9AGAR|nr:hypothetical protein B0H16DRAFT_1747739 [Mycena metata]
MPLQRVFKAQVITGEDTPASDSPSTWAIRSCDLRGCKNHEKLEKCARCRTAMYCSRECQKADWARHKPYCKMTTDFPSIRDPANSGEAPLQRHLRLWTARFDASLICAAIVALQLNKQPSNIDTLGMLITLRPRPHPEAGARFQLVSAEVIPMAQMMAILVDYQQAQARAGADVGPTLAELHQQHRDALRAKSGGTEDYATSIVIARNEGPYPLPGEHNMEVRFKPLNIHRKFVRSPMLTDPTLDWYGSLEYQVNNDVPNREKV